MTKLLVYVLILGGLYLVMTAPSQAGAEQTSTPVQASSCEVQARQAAYPDWSSMSYVARLDAAIQIIKHCEEK